MKKRNWIFSTVLAGSILTVGAVGVANAFGGPGCGPGGGFGGRGQGDKIMHMIEKLDLSKEQRTAIWGIMDQQKDNMRENREDMYAIHKALRESATADSYDKGKVRELADKKASMMSDMIVLRTEAMNQIRNQLTDEQVDLFNKFQDRSFGRGRF